MEITTEVHVNLIYRHDRHAMAKKVDIYTKTPTALYNWCIEVLGQYYDGQNLEEEEAAIESGDCDEVARCFIRHYDGFDVEVDRKELMLLWGD